MALQDDLDSYINTGTPDLEYLVSTYQISEIVSAMPYKVDLDTGMTIGFAPLSGPNNLEVCVVGVHPVFGGFWTQISKDNCCAVFARMGSSQNPVQ